MLNTSQADITSAHAGSGRAARNDATAFSRGNSVQKQQEKSEIDRLRRETVTLRNDLKVLTRKFNSFLVDVHLAMFGGRTKDKSGKITEYCGLFGTIDELTRQVGDGMRYRGVYEPSRQYTAGDVVTFSGSAFYCKAVTSAKPEESAADWVLCVKRGRDGRDGKAFNANTNQS